MGIEQDIHQRQFKNERHKAIVNLIFTYHWSTEKMRSFFESEEITQQQFNILRILRGAGGPLSTLQIRQRMLDKMSDTSRIVDRLIQKELVAKSVCKNDKRLVDVIISPKGKKLLKRLDAAEESVDNILMNLSDEETAQLNSLLDKIRSTQ